MTSSLRLSFEFFPPKSDALEQALWKAVERLKPLAPDFVSVTYGAGGSTRERTHAIVTALQQQHGLNAAAHLTCVGATKDEIHAIADSYWHSGIRSLVALRGDPPGGVNSAYTPHPDGYDYADTLVAGLKALHDFDLFVGAYPETHPQAPSPQADLDHLLRKQAAGATRAITQFFFDADIFLRFRDTCLAHGITMPILPGILPIANFTRACDFAASCGASIPENLHAAFAKAGDDAHAQQQVSLEHATRLCQKLQQNGVDHLHFYTLNRADITVAVCQELGYVTT